MAFRNELLMEWQRREFITSGAKAAKIIGITAGYYLELRKGLKQPSIETLEKISAKTGYTYDQLLGKDIEQQTAAEETTED